MTTASIHICCDVRDVGSMEIARDRAKEQGKSFAAYVVSLIKKDLVENKAQNELPILNLSSKPRQTTITEYDIKLFEPSEERLEKISELPKDQLNKLAIAVTHLQNQIKAVREFER